MPLKAKTHREDLQQRGLVAKPTPRIVASAHKRGYGVQWRRARLWRLKRFPMCELCYAGGVYRPAKEVHHIIPIKKKGTNAFDNLQALCIPCHRKITVRDGKNHEAAV